MRPTTASAVAVLLACVAATGCTDPALVDRVADLERTQEQLRAEVADLDGPGAAPTPDEDPLRAEVDSLAASVADLDDRLAVVSGELTALTDGTAADALSADERLTTVELQLGELRSSISRLEDQLAALGDRTTSLDVQLDSHADDPGAHAGAPGSQ